MNDIGLHMKTKFSNDVNKQWLNFSSALYNKNSQITRNLSYDSRLSVWGHQYVMSASCLILINILFVYFGQIIVLMIMINDFFFRYHILHSLVVTFTPHQFFKFHIRTMYIRTLHLIIIKRKMSLLQSILYFYIRTECLRCHR